MPATMIDTPRGIERVRILAVAGGLEFYAKHNIRINTAYTPTNMLRVATNITGRPYKRSTAGYLAAAADLRALL